jgi:hypothetical protein
MYFVTPSPPRVPPMTKAGYPEPVLRPVVVARRYDKMT